MLRHEKLTSTESALFTRLDSLYSTAFPWHEQREMSAKHSALNHPAYALDAWFDAEHFVGLSGVWTFKGYSYIEHLAVDSSLRSQGYGKRVLSQILQRQPLTILEIDPLISEIAHKRLRFYQSMGFAANPQAHTHPSYHAGIEDHELLVLSYPTAIDDVQYQKFSQDLSRVVMARE